MNNMLIKEELFAFHLSPALDHVGNSCVGSTLFLVPSDLGCPTLSRFLGHLWDPILTLKAHSLITVHWCPDPAPGIIMPKLHENKSYVSLQHHIPCI